MNYKQNISIIILCYNEENRIENILRSSLWSNDIIVYNKSSTDSTVEIASKYPCKIITVPYWDTGAGIMKDLASFSKNEWVLTLGCSDIIHPVIAKNLLTLINTEPFDYDIIAFPYQVGVFGIFNKRSPWYSESKQYLYRKSVANYTDIVHQELKFSSNRVYHMPPSEREAIFHLTHENLDTFFERHIRYTNAEAKLEISNNRKLVLFKCIKEVLVNLRYLIIRKKTWIMGWNGIGLTIAFISYFIMKFLFSFQSIEGNGEKRYNEIQKNILTEWDKRSK